MGNNPPPPNVSPLRIFVVENHADSLKYLTLYLEMMGHAVQSATTMAEALARLPAADCEVLISDVGLPDGDGWELLRTVRLSRAVYPIAMSGFGMNADRANSKAAGYRHHLLKPFVPTELDAALAEAAGERKADAARPTAHRPRVASKAHKKSPPPVAVAPARGGTRRTDTDR